MLNKIKSLLDESVQNAGKRKFVFTEKMYWFSDAPQSDMGTRWNPDLEQEDEPWGEDDYKEFDKGDKIGENDFGVDTKDLAYLLRTKSIKRI